MRAAGRASSGEVVIQATEEELVLIYGGLVEAMEALSSAEFRARVGVPASAAEPLLEALRTIIGEFKRR